MKQVMVRRWFVATALLVFLGLHGAEWTVGVPDLVRCYLDDLLCLPLVLVVVSLAQGLIPDGGPATGTTGGAAPSVGSGPLPWYHGALAFVFFSLVFEVWLPSRSAGYTGDAWDVVMYGIGWLVFEVVWSDRLSVASSRSPSTVG